MSCLRATRTRVVSRSYQVGSIGCLDLNVSVLHLDCVSPVPRKSAQDLGAAGAASWGTPTIFLNLQLEQDHVQLHVLWPVTFILEHCTGGG